MSLILETIAASLSTKVRDWFSWRAGSGVPASHRGAREWGVSSLLGFPQWSGGLYPALPPREDAFLSPECGQS